MHRYRFRPGTTLVVALTLVASVATGVVTSTASSSGQLTRAITPSPVWPAKTLSAPAAANWHSYYGALTGQRYSSLKQITTANVGQLKELWHISLGSCTAGLIAGDPVIPGAPRGATNNPTNCGSMESNPVAIDGVLYTTNAPVGAVWAIDAKTGATIWKYTPSYAGEFLNSGVQFTPGNGGRRAGVAVGEGKVFNGLPDGRLVALDQVTGKQLWESFVGSYKVNAKISTAPIYVNGMVIVGDGSGDGGGASATISAFRAANGGKIWTWSAIPAPGQPGYKTWTNDGKGGNGSSLYGGGSFWESPIIDTKRNIADHRHAATRSRGTRAAPARTCTATRSSRSTSTRVSSSGTSSRSITTCGTRTCRTTASCSRASSRSTARWSARMPSPMSTRSA